MVSNDDLDSWLVADLGLNSTQCPPDSLESAQTLPPSEQNLIHDSMMTSNSVLLQSLATSFQNGPNASITLPHSVIESLLKKQWNAGESTTVHQIEYTEKPKKIRPSSKGKSIGSTLLNESMTTLDDENKADKRTGKWDNTRNPESYPATKRIKNTIASQKFRLKKKQIELEMENRIADLEEVVDTLTEKCKEQEMELKILRRLIAPKDNSSHGQDSQMC
jgi:hypothetical protein